MTLPGADNFIAVPLFTAVLLAATLAAAPSPSPVPQQDSCASGAHTSLLAAMNRPTIGFSACAVKAKDFLAELGYANQSGDTSQATLPQGFLRYGIGHGLEADFIGPAFQVNRPGFSGLQDAGVGAKWQFASTASNAAAVDVLYTLPTGARGLTNGRPVETLNVDYAHAVSAHFGLAMTLGAAQSHYFAALPSLVLTNQYNARSQLYAEFYAQTATRPGGGALAGLDGGLQYLVSPQIEIDVEAGRTITDVARNHYYGFGIGVRL